MFEIQQQPAKLVHLNIRTEKHGDDDVRAVDLKFERVGSNKILDDLVPGLRTALFRTAQPGDQGDVFLGADGLTALAFPQIEQPMKLAGEWPGYVATIEPVMGLSDPLVLNGDLKKHKLEAVQGGSTKHEFTVSCYPDDYEVGRLASALGKEVTLTLEAPKPAASNDVDGEGEGEDADAA